MDKSIRSFREKIQDYTELKIQPKKFIIRTFGDGCYNQKPLILELDYSYQMWEDGVGRLKIGYDGKEVYFDIIEFINYLRTGLNKK